jgi:hypothetical protein
MLLNKLKDAINTFVILVLLGIIGSLAIYIICGIPLGLLSLFLGFLFGVSVVKLIWIVYTFVFYPLIFFFSLLVVFTDYFSETAHQYLSKQFESRR